MNSVIIYRIGGTANYQWKATGRFNWEDAQKKAREVRRMGYPAFIATPKQLEKIGLDISYLADEYFSIN